MCCIKQIELTSIWGVLEIHSIFRNLVRWAIRVLRPSISCQISRWRPEHDDSHDPGQMFLDTVQVKENKGSLPGEKSKDQQPAESKRSQEHTAKIAALNRYIDQMEMHNETLQGRVSDLEHKLKDKSKEVTQPSSDATSGASATPGTKEFPIRESQQTRSSLPEVSRNTACNSSMNRYAKSVSDTT